LAQVVISQRERTIGIRAVAGGLVAHTLDEQRDINHGQSILDDAAEMKADPEIVALAKKLIDRVEEMPEPRDITNRESRTVIRSDQV
jgi:DNA end-binding protein Ku